MGRLNKLSQSAAALAVLAFGLVACVEPQRFEALEQVNPLRILVLPPQNNSPEIKGTYTFLSTISKPLGERGYYVYPVAVVDSYIKANGVTLPQEMNQIPLDKLNAQFAPDAILYTDIDYFGQKFALIDSYAYIDAHLELVDAATGNTLWQKNLVYDERQNRQQQGDSSALGQIIGAVIVQVIASAMDDKFFGASSSAAMTALHDPINGLPVGPLLPRE